MALVILFCFVSCGTGQNKEKEFEYANSAYEKLVVAANLCEAMMDVVYAAGVYAVYQSDNMLGYSQINRFAKAIGMTYDEVMAGMNAYGLDKDDYCDLSKATPAMQIASAALIKNGTCAKVEEYMSEAKDELKQVTADYADYTGYPTLKTFYSEISSYLEFIKNPSVSFSQVETTVNAYETNIRTYKNDLNFIFE